MLGWRMFADWRDGDVDVDCVPLLVGLRVCVMMFEDWHA